jgi:cation diffusion facilitator family transporter
VLWLTLLLNCLVAFTKLSVGLIIQSLSMMADGVHSLLDGVSNVVGLVAIRWAYSPPDRDHPYGHRKFETLAAMGISFLLFLSCFQIVEHAIDRLRHPGEVSVRVWALAALIATMGVNLVISTYEMRRGKELKSEFLQADAVHTRTDFYGALLVLISLLAAKAGYPKADAIGALFVVVVIARAGYRIILGAFESLSDRMRIDPGEIFECVMGVEGILGCHNIRSRGVGDQIHVDFHILVAPSVPTARGHELQHEVMRRVRERFAQVIDVVVHLEPADASGSTKDASDIILRSGSSE